MYSVNLTCVCQWTDFCTRNDCAVARSGDSCRSHSSSSWAPVELQLSPTPFQLSCSSAHNNYFSLWKYNHFWKLGTCSTPSLLFPMSRNSKTPHNANLIVKHNWDMLNLLHTQKMFKQKMFAFRGVFRVRDIGDIASGSTTTFGNFVRVKSTCPLEHVNRFLHVSGSFLFNAEKFIVTLSNIRLRAVFEWREIRGRLLSGCTQCLWDTFGLTRSANGTERFPHIWERLAACREHFAALMEHLAWYMEHLFWHPHFLRH